MVIDGDAYLVERDDIDDKHIKPSQMDKINT